MDNRFSHKPKPGAGFKRYQRMETAIDRKTSPIRPKWVL